MFDWNGYFQISKLLLNVGESRRDQEIEEACYRCVISRAYYYVYNNARNVAKNNGYEHNAKYGRGSHQEIIDYLNGIGKSVASSYLSKLKKFRVDSDYEENITITVNKAKTAMTFVSTIEKNL
ncbi:MAG: hypothetical protein V1848_01745 [Candidatus Magasanikbacteria bacterium]